MKKNTTEREPMKERPFNIMVGVFIVIRETFSNNFTVYINVEYLIDEQYWFCHNETLIF